MENQSRYDLNAAVQGWRKELASQPNLTTENQRELETHLRDTIADLQRLGLNDEESFWLARRRVGQPDKLGQEYEKAVVMKPWRKRLLWVAAALFAIPFLVGASPWRFYTMLFYANGLGVAHWINVATVVLLYWWPVAGGLAISVARGRSIISPAAWFCLIRSRRRFFIVACIWALALECQKLIMVAIDRGLFDNVYFMNFGPFSYGWGGALDLAVIALVLWLLPAEKSRVLKRA